MGKPVYQEASYYIVTETLIVRGGADDVERTTAAARHNEPNLGADSLKHSGNRNALADDCRTDAANQILILTIN